MAEFTDAQWDAAEERGRIAYATTPRAVAVRYDSAMARIVVDLANGSTFLFDPLLAQGLEHADERDLAAVELLGAGFGLHWEALDVDLRVDALMSGRFGSRRYMADRFGPDWNAKAAE